MVITLYIIRYFSLQDHPSVLEELDLVEEEDQFTHLLTLEDAGDPENMLSMFNMSVILNVSVNIVNKACRFVIPSIIRYRAG